MASSIYVVISQDSYYPSGDDYDWEFITTDYDAAIADAKLRPSGKYGWTSVVRISLPDCEHALIWTSERDLV